MEIKKAEEKKVEEKRERAEEMFMRKKLKKEEEEIVLPKLFKKERKKKKTYIPKLDETALVMNDDAILHRNKSEIKIPNRFEVEEIMNKMATHLKESIANRNDESMQKKEIIYDLDKLGKNTRFSDSRSNTKKLSSMPLGQNSLKKMSGLHQSMTNLHIVNPLINENLNINKNIAYRNKIMKEKKEILKQNTAEQKKIVMFNMKKSLPLITIENKNMRPEEGSENRSSKIKVAFEDKV